MFKYFLISLLIFVFIACSKNKKTKCGIDYQLIETKNGTPLKVGDFIQIVYHCIDDKDSIIASNLNIKKPFILKLKHFNIDQTDVNETLSYLSDGDSAIIYPNAIQFLSKTLNLTKIPNSYKKDSKFKFSLRIVKILSKDEMRQIKIKEDQVLAQTEKQLLDNYLEIQHIKCKADSNGLYFMEVKKGSGPLINRKMNIKISYKGFFVNGLEFASSEKDNELLDINFQKNNLILGWEIALLKMRRGGEVNLIIPSKLAYGELGLKGLVSPYTSLIFNIKVIDIND